MHAVRDERREPEAHAVRWPFAPLDARAALPLAPEFQVNLERILQVSRSCFRIDLTGD